LSDEVKSQINLSGGTLSGDDTVIDKPYREPSLTELLGYYWSSKHPSRQRGAFNYIVHRESANLSPLLSPLNKQEGKPKRLFQRDDGSFKLGTDKDGDIRRLVF